MADINVKVELKDGSKLTINKSAINSVSSLTQSNTDASTIFYGVVSNTGDIEISDKNSDIKNLVEDGRLDDSGVKLDVFANGKQVQSHITSESGYQDQVLNISLTDDLSNLSTSIYSNPEESNYLSELTGLELLTKICQKCSPQINIPISGSNNLPYTDASMLNVYEYLNMIKFRDIDLSLDSGNAQDLLNHFCNATQLNLFNGSNGDEVVVSARPVVSNVKSSNLSNRPIMVEKKDILQNGQSTVFLKNKVKQVNINPFEFKEYKEMDSVPIFSNETLSEELLNSSGKSFFKSQIVFNSGDGELSNPIMDDNGYYIYTESVLNDFYTKFQTDHIIAYQHPLVGIFPEEFSYVKDGSGNYFKVSNYSTVDSFLNTVSSYTGNDKVLVGFLNSKPTIYRKGYTIIYAIKKDIFDTNWADIPIRFWIVSGVVKVSSKPLNWTVPRIYIKKEKLSFKFGDESNIKSNELFNIDENPFLTSTSTISVYGKNVPLYEYVAMNILNDYLTGIKTKTAQVACSDLYYTHNKLKAKNWSRGEVLDVGDIVNIATEKRLDGTYIDWKVTGREFVFDGVPVLNLELQECKSIEKLYNYTSDISWSEISEISKSGKAEQYFSIGDEKYIDSIGATMVVLGFNHDTKPDGTKAGITFGLKYDSVANGTNYYMKWADTSDGVPYNSNAGGWDLSNARKLLNTNFFDSLPEDLRNSIVEVEKDTSKGGGSSILKVSSDKIWIPSEVEMTGSATYSANGEGSQYPFFKTDWTNGYKTWQRYFGVLRSPNLSNTSSMIKKPNTSESEVSNATNSFLFVNGFVSAIEPTSSFNQIICFCI